MQRTPPESPSTSPIPGWSKGKGTGKGASNRNQDPPPHDETVCDSVKTKVNRVTHCLTTSMPNTLWKKSRSLGTTVLVAMEKLKRSSLVLSLISLLHSIWKLQPAWESSYIIWQICIEPLNLLLTQLRFFTNTKFWLTDSIPLTRTIMICLRSYTST